MKKQIELQKNNQDENTNKSRLDLGIPQFMAKTATKFKKYFVIGGLAGVALLFNGCYAGYVGTQPSYMETSRPSSPSSVHVWVDGNWVWSNNSQSYKYSNGYWKKPHKNRKFVAGHWVSEPRGHRWVKGHWTR